MIKKVLNILAIVLVLLVAVGYWAYRTYVYEEPLISADDRSELTLMPLPTKMAFQNGTYQLGPGFKVEYSLKSSDKIEKGIERLRTRLSGSEGGNIIIEIQEIGPEYPEIHMDESYSISINSDGIRIEASNDYGALYALESISQLSKSGNIRHLEMTDNPRFTWRGVMIDVSRHWISKEVILRNLDAMAAAKLNVLHFHLSDDQGFRLESKAFPRLHEIGSNGHYYSQEEMRDIIRYAADRGIRVVPEFDVPGHSKSWLIAYPEYSSSSESLSWGRKSDEAVFSVPMDITKDITYEFLDAFIKEMADLFPDKYYHIGGDEVNPQPWLDNKNIKEFMGRQALHDGHELQAYFNNRLKPIVDKHDKTMMGWEEILHPNLGDNIVIQSWTNQKTLFKGAREGRDAVLSAGWYLDHKLHAEKHYQVDPHVLPGAVDIIPDSSMWKMYDITIQPPGGAIESQIILFDRNPEDVFGYFAMMDSRMAFKGGQIKDGKLSFGFSGPVGEMTYSATLENDTLAGEIGFGLLKFDASGMRTGGSDMPGTKMPRIELVKPLTEEEKKFVLGGEAAMWSEVVSDLTVESRIWPRSAAIAEKLWSPDQTANDVPDMYRRLEIFSEHIEGFGMKHRTYRDQIVNTWNLKDNTAILELLEITEEVKYYNRLAFLFNEDEIYLPDFVLNDVADASFPESEKGRRFNQMVSTYTLEPTETKKTEILHQVTKWVDLHNQLTNDYQASEKVEQVSNLVERLSRLSSFIVNGIDGNPEEARIYIDESLSLMENGENGVIISVAPGLKALLSNQEGSTD